MEDKDPISNHIIDNLTSGDAVEKDSVLLQWLSEDETHKLEFERYRKIWKESSRYKDPDTFDAVSAWHLIDDQNFNRMKKERFASKFLYSVYGIAAAGLILLVLSLSGLFDKPIDSTATFSAAYGSNASAVLPDGSHVVLNAGSTLAYTFMHKEKIRSVDFKGEGFFHVAKDKNPFVIKLAEGLQVRVWGTSFNIQAYGNEEIIEASLVEGKIEMTYSNQRLMMKPGEVASFDKITHNIKLEKRIASHAYGWLDNKLYMDNMSLAQVCRYLERRYDIKISILPYFANSIHYSGVLEEESLTEILNALSRLSAIDYSIKGKNICITSKNVLPMQK